MRRRPRIVAAAVGAASLLALTACNDTTTEVHGHNYVVYPDVQYFVDAGEPVMQVFAHCSGGWIARSNWWRVTDLNGRSLVASCYPDVPVGGGYTTVAG